MNVKRIYRPETEPFSFNDWIKLLFEESKDGDTVEISVFLNVDSNDFYRCQLDWDAKKYDALLKKFSTHFKNLETIAPLYEELEKETQSPKQILGNEELADFWNKYVRPFDSGDFDAERIFQIVNHIDLGEELSQEEKDDYDIYLKIIRAEAEKRVGNPFCSYELVIRSKRLCRLMSLKAPKIIISNEAFELATIMVVSECGVSCEKISEN
jgi:hypothetical protein